MYFLIQSLSLWEYKQSGSCNKWFGLAIAVLWLLIQCLEHRNLTIAGCIEEQPSGKVEIEGAGSCKEPSLSARIAGGLAESPVSDEGHEAACVAASDGKHLLVCVINSLAFLFLPLCLYINCKAVLCDIMLIYLSQRKRSSSSNIKTQTRRKKGSKCLVFDRKMEGFKKEEIRKGPWKAEEDEVLIKHVKKYGPRDWSSIRSKGLLQRTGKSCRLRWVNKLRPNLKHGCKFSAEEERVVIDLQAEFGNKWARIATYLPGRTDNDVKNFWSSRQKRLARILQTSGTPSSSNSKPQKNKNEVPVFQDVPTLEAPVFSSSMEEETTYFDNPEQIRMMPLPSLVKTELPDGYANLGQYEPLSTIPFPQIPQLQPDLLFSPESHELLARLDDPYFLSVLGIADTPELGDAAQFSPGPPLFDPVSGCENSATTNPVTPDTLFDEFPSDMFDHIEPLPSPSEW
ncbi:hypothetical protein SADUNF_Sadunf02G0118600 [Salix dunnii]|uniref:Uncharacterized protein n=1 Tax=Salix dunnii TaxID=1413687 RepID=A0A835N7G5_9ROSI|nr:hypothetical protein SADUNF_Sadunf02G0118600 [Salix dunnii]